MAKAVRSPRVDALLVLPPGQTLSHVYPAPYLLANYLEQQGHRAAVWDVSWNAVPMLLRSGVADAAGAECNGKVKAYERRSRLTGRNRQRYADALRASLRIGFVRRHRREILKNGFFRTLSWDGANYTSMLREVEAGILGGTDADAVAIEEMLAEKPSPRLMEFLRAPTLALLRRLQPKVIGVSIPFRRLLAPTLAFATLVRRSGFDTHICLGGSVISLLPESPTRALLSSGLVDSIIRHEGEIALAELVASRKAGRDPAAIPEVVTLAKLGKPTSTGRRLEPREWTHTKAPLRPCADGREVRPAFVSVLQSTGCYWGKCAFCDYVNLSCQSRYRPRKAEDTVSDIEYYGRQGIDGISLIAEAIPPGHVRQIIEQLDKCSVRPKAITSFFRVDEHFDIETLRSVARVGWQPTIGLETSNDRLLRLINKGSSHTTARTMLDRFMEVGLHVSINIIVDIPTTTYEEALGVFDFCSQYRSIATFNTTTFMLSPTSDMGRHPERYGIEVLSEKTIYERDCLAALQFRAPGTMTAEETKEILGRYHQLNADKQRAYNDKRVFGPTLSIVDSAQRPEDLAGLRFTFPRETNFSTHPVPFSDRGNRTAQASTWLYLGRSNRDTLLNSEMGSVLALVAGKTLTFKHISSLLTRHFSADCGMDELAFAFIRACRNLGVVDRCEKVD